MAIGVGVPEPEEPSPRNVGAVPPDWIGSCQLVNVPGSAGPWASWAGFLYWSSRMFRGSELVTGENFVDGFHLLPVQTATTLNMLLRRLFGVETPVPARAQDREVRFLLAGDYRFVWLVRELAWGDSSSYQFGWDTKLGSVPGMVLWWCVAFPDKWEEHVKMLKQKYPPGFLRIQSELAVKRLEDEKFRDRLGRVSAEYRKLSEVATQQVLSSVVAAAGSVVAPLSAYVRVAGSPQCQGPFRSAAEKMAEGLELLVPSREVEQRLEEMKVRS